MKKLFEKGPITTIIGLLILIGIGYKIVIEKGIDYQDAISLAIAFGLIGAKDKNQSHTKDKSNPPPEDEEENPG